MSLILPQVMWFRLPESQAETASNLLFGAAKRYFMVEWPMTARQCRAGQWGDW